MSRRYLKKQLQNLKKEFDDEYTKDKEEEKIIKNGKNVDLRELLMIKPYDVPAQKNKSPPAMEAIGFKHPTSILVCGMTGSGKSVFVCNLLTNKHMFYKYFDQVYLFSRTGNQDDTFKELGLPDKNIITDNMEERLEEIINKQERLVEEEGIMNAPKICIIFEDSTSEKKLQRSKLFTQSFVQNRHINSTTITCCHKYNGVDRTARLNCNHTIIFPCTNSEKEILREEHMPPNMNKEQFNNIIQEAFTPDEYNKKPFLHINSKAPFEQKFRKGLGEIIKPK